MALKLVIAPAVEPLTIDDVAAQIQAGYVPADQMDLIGGFIAAIRQRAELELGRALITQTWDLVLDAFPPATQCNPFAGLPIPYPTLRSVVSVQYLGVDAQMHTMSADDYQVDTDSTPGGILPIYGKSWPFTLAYPGAVRVRFTAGYGDAATDVPACIRQWMLLNIAALYENREQVVVGNGGMIDISTFADALLDPERWEVRL